MLKLVENEESRAKGLSLLFGTIKFIIKAPGPSDCRLFSQSDQLFEGEDGYEALKSKRTRLCIYDTLLKALSLAHIEVMAMQTSCLARSLLCGFTITMRCSRPIRSFSKAKFPLRLFLCTADYAVNFGILHAVSFSIRLTI